MTDSTDQRLPAWQSRLRATEDRLEIPCLPSAYLPNACGHSIDSDAGGVMVG